MKVNIFARPDHSVFLFEDLKNFEDIDADYYTFFATRKGSLLNRLMPNRKTVSEQANTLDFLTLIGYASYMLGQKIDYNWFAFRQKLFDFFIPRDDFKQCEVFHYWPFYCPKFAREIVSEGRVKTVAEFYEAEPSFVNDIYDLSYKKYNLTSKKVNNLINQNEAFEFEKNFIVASNYTKDSYLKIFPDANIHVCPYGPIGNSLRKDVDVKISASLENKNKKGVFVGQVCLEKGADLLIEASDICGIEIDFIGPVRAGQEAIFESLFSRSKCSKSLGGKRNVEVLRLLDNYDFFALPSLSDNYSLAVNEALSRGLPVLISKNCGNKDDVDRYGLGFCSDVNNRESIVEGLNYLYSKFHWNEFNVGLKKFFSVENRMRYSQSVVDVYRAL